MRPKVYLHRVLAALMVMIFIGGLSLFSNHKGNRQPGVIKGAKVQILSGTLVHWKDLKKVRFDRLKTRRMKPVLNFKNPKKIVRKDTAPDPVVQDTFTGKAQSSKRSTLAMEAVRDFAGMSFSANGAGWPPDTCGDVGPTYYVQAVNTSIGIFDKNSGELVSATTFDAFFPSSVGPPCDGDNNGDVIVLYDIYSQRWFLLDFAWFSSESGGSYYSIAASKTGDPTGAWWTYCLQADTTLLNDYPKCGVWHDGIYITANMFQFSGNSQYAKVWALKIPDLYNGTLVSHSIIDTNYYAWALLPANAKGPNAPPQDAPNYMYAMDAGEYGGQSTDTLYVWKYDVDWENPGNTTWTGPTEISGVASFGLVSDGVPQPGTYNTLDNLYGRLMYPANYINHTTHESVYLCHLVEYDNQRTMRWYEIRISGGNSSLYQQGTYAPDTHHRWMGSICGDKNDNIAMGYSISSSTLYPSVRYCGRTASDTPGAMGQGEATMINGSGFQSSYTRWGDYSHLTLDPDDHETFWYTQEYYSTSGTDWQTRIGAFKITEGSPPPTGDIGEAVDNTSLNFSKTGSVHWTKVTDVYYSGGDSAKTGAINHNQLCSIETLINFPSLKNIKFYWKVSSEANYDYLRFYIDGALQDQVSGIVDWRQKSYNISSGIHTLKWTYYKDGSVSSGPDCGWVDKLEITDPPPGNDRLAEAVDSDKLVFNTTGDGDWDSQTATYYYDGDAAQSPVLAHNHIASMQTEISGFTTVKFQWKVSSEANYDYLGFYIDGVLKDRISGNVDWQQESYNVSTGAHTLRWIYAKDYSVSSGSDCGWVDKLELGAGMGCADPIASALDDYACQSYNNYGDGQWVETIEDYSCGRSSMISPSALSHNQSATIETTISGYTFISFQWKVSSEANYDYLEFYIDGYLQDQVSGNVDWQQKNYSISSGTHTLKWTYAKDYSISSGSDSGWLDCVTFQQ